MSDENFKALFEECQLARDEAGFLGSVPDCIRCLDAEIAKLREENDRLREAMENARSQAIDDTLAALTAHELYQYRPKAFHGFIEYAETLKDEANAQLWRAALAKEPTP